MKLTKKQIDLIIEKTKKELKGTQRIICEYFGYYKKSDVNWATYNAGWDYDNNLIVTVFGEVQ